MEGYHHLSREERRDAAAYRRAGWSVRRIAGELKRSPSTISREFRRNESVGGKYDPDKADAKAKNRIRGRPERKIRERTKEFDFVTDGLMNSWSAERISGRYRRENPGKLLSRQVVSRFIYSLENAGLRVKEYITWQRTRHRQRGRRKSKRIIIPDRTGIEARSEEANGRTEFGHWECDLLCFSKQKGVILHIVERKTRFGKAMLLPSKNADGVADALREILGKLIARNPESVKSVTFDNGSEFVRHGEIGKELGFSTFFCHPYTSCEKGTVENANGIMRRYLPRRTNLSTLDQDELDDIRMEMNQLPMKVLDYLTPAEAFKSEMLSSLNTHPVALHL